MNWFLVLLLVMQSATSSHAKRTRTRLELQRACVNQTALADVLRVVRENPDAANVGRSIWSLQRSLAELWSVVGQSEKLSTPSGDFDWDTISLPALLQLCEQESVEFADLLADTFAKYPCTPERPWRLIMNFDECTPGMILSLNNRRKLWAVMVSQMLGNRKRFSVHRAGGRAVGREGGAGTKELFCCGCLCERCRSWSLARRSCNLKVRGYQLQPSDPPSPTSGWKVAFRHAPEHCCVDGSWPSRGYNQRAYS